MEVAAAIAAFLAPYLKSLLDPTAEEAGRRLNATAWRHASAIWRRLREPVAERPSAQEAAEDVAAAPDDQDALGALRLQLKKLLEQDPALAQELAGMLDEAKQAGATTITVQSIGERSIAVNQASGSVLSTGDAPPQDRPT